jgi:hypothetical protein
VCLVLHKCLCLIRVLLRYAGAVRRCLLRSLKVSVAALWSDAKACFCKLVMEGVMAMEDEPRGVRVEARVQRVLVAMEDPHRLLLLKTDFRRTLHQETVRCVPRRCCHSIVHPRAVNCLWCFKSTICCVALAICFRQTRVLETVESKLRHQYSKMLGYVSPTGVAWSVSVSACVRRGVVVVLCGSNSKLGGGGDVQFGMEANGCLSVQGGWRRGAKGREKRGHCEDSLDEGPCRPNRDMCSVRYWRYCGFPGSLQDSPARLRSAFALCIPLHRTLAQDGHVHLLLERNKTKEKYEWLLQLKVPDAQPDPGFRDLKLLFDWILHGLGTVSTEPWLPKTQLSNHIRSKLDAPTPSTPDQVVAWFSRDAPDRGFSRISVVADAVAKQFIGHYAVAKAR